MLPILPYRVLAAESAPGDLRGQSAAHTVSPFQTFGLC